MNDHHIVGRFPFSCDGHGNRRDNDALPRIAVVAIDVDGYALEYHEAGEEFVRSVPLTEIKVEDHLIEGMGAHDAFLVGAWCERALNAYREIVDSEVQP